MFGIIEAVPNISEGRRQDVIDAVAEAFGSPRGTRLLDVSSDPSHNRTVLTALGDRDSLEQSALRLFEACLERIDLRAHQGQHPRIGAVDVLPFVPLRGATMAECISLARRVSERAALRFDVPIFLYEEAARQEDRSDLASIRRGEFEGLGRKLGEPSWKPDFGPLRPHPSAGASAVGARKILIAFNVNLNSDQIEIAQTVARRVRASSGGLASVKALGFFLAHRNQVQVSMNLTDYRTTPILRAFEKVRFETERLGATIAGSEIVGLVPQEALPKDPASELQLLDFREEQILEVRAKQAGYEALF